jgi:hypothetical protein
VTECRARVDIAPQANERLVIAGVRMQEFVEETQVAGR